MSDYKYGEEGELQVQRAHRTSGCFPLSIYLSIYLSLSVLYSLWTAGLQCEEGVVSFTCVQVFSDRSLVTFLLETSILLFFPIIFDMDDLYRLQHEGISISGANAAAATIDFRRSVENSNVYRFESVETEAGMSDLIKSQIVNHPRYPNLVSAYIECRKVASMLLSPVAFKALFFFFFSSPQFHRCFLIFFFFFCLFFLLQVGAPPEMASLLEEIGRESQPMNSRSGEIGADPELDEFMVFTLRIKSQKFSKAEKIDRNELRRGL